jgi:hypothetical protein
VRRAISTVTSRPEEYRRYAEECWKFANDAEGIETKAVFQLTAEAWTLLAAQVETLEGVQGTEGITPPLLQSAA